MIKKINSTEIKIINSFININKKNMTSLDIIKYTNINYPNLMNTIKLMVNKGIIKKNNNPNTKKEFIFSLNKKASWKSILK